jgi:hypothetical protein
MRQKLSTWMIRQSNQNNNWSNTSSWKYHDLPSHILTHNFEDIEAVTQWYNNTLTDYTNVLHKYHLALRDRALTAHVIIHPAMDLISYPWHIYANNGLINNTSIATGTFISKVDQGLQLAVVAYILLWYNCII